MAVSVRMDPLLEKEMEQAARRRGITKSQFIVEAVERALGKNDPGELYLKVMQELDGYKIGTDTAAADLVERSPHKQALYDKLRAKHTQESADYDEFLKARQSPLQGGVV